MSSFQANILIVVFRSYALCKDTRNYKSMLQLNWYQLVLGNIPVISLHRGIKFIPVTLLRISLYRYYINYIFLWLRGVYKVVNRVAST